VLVNSMHWKGSFKIHVNRIRGENAVSSVLFASGLRFHFLIGVIVDVSSQQISKALTVLTYSQYIGAEEKRQRTSKGCIMHVNLVRADGGARGFAGGFLTLSRILNHVLYTRGGSEV
jgi:hypothetical protein